MSTLNHEELLESWKTDSTLDRSDLMSSLYQLPMLHSKYLTYLQGYKMNLRKYILKYSKLKGIKIRYYNGELTESELKLNEWKQYLFKKPLKSELESLLESDQDLLLIQEQSVYLESLVSATESIMKDINSRYFLLKNIVELTKFEAGG